jgi:hypothetical protein
MGELDDQYFDKVSADMDPFKKLVSKIPGFKGYIERQARRDSDKLLRDAIYNRFRELEDQISALQRDFIRHGELKYIDDLEASALKLRTFADRIRVASRGYSSLFEAVKINESELRKLYEFDVALFDKADDVDRAIANVQSSVGTDGLPAAIRNLETVSSDCISMYDMREQVVAVSQQDLPDKDN